MKKGILKYNGKDFVLEGIESGGKELEIAGGIKEEEGTKYLDEAFYKELEESDLNELQGIANEHLEKTTSKEVEEAIKGRVDSVKKLADSYEELKKHYIEMQKEADNRDGGGDKTNPNYYKTREMESIEIMELKHGTKATMAFCILNSERYEYRVGNKRIQEDNAELDLEKADWYLKKYKELSEKIGTEREIKGMSTILG